MSAATVDPRPGNLLLYGATALLLAVSIGVQVVRDRGWQPYEPANPVMWLQSGPLAQRLSLGFPNLVADVYWMRAVVYYGGQRHGAVEHRNFEHLAPLLDLATTLDPRFKMAYRFGAIFLTEAYPNGPARPDLAIALLQRGIQANPTSWEYPHDIGFVYYWWIHDYGKSAAWFAKAAELPGAPTWLRPLAASTLAVGGDRRSSRLLWTQILETADEDWLRKSATHALLQLDAMDQLEVIDKMRAAVTGERLIPDPTGVPYVFDPQTGHMTVSRSSTLWPLPSETKTILK